MAYQENLKKSARWLIQIQNKDGGWGLTPKQASSLVNTAEALFVLSRAGFEKSDSAVRGLEYLRDNISLHLEQRGERTRFVAFPLYVLTSCFPEFDRRVPRRLLKWLVDAVNEDGGWGAEKDATKSDVYSTYLAVLAIKSADPDHVCLVGAQNWFLSKGGVQGWSFEEDGQNSLSATSYALIALSELGCGDHDLVETGLKSLMAIKHWEDEDATLAGTMWRHCTHSNVLSALIMYSDDIFASPIAAGLRHSNRHISPKGGWMETIDSLENRSVRSQFWAVSYSDRMLQKFDPSKYIPRVDAERQSKTLKEPAFQHFLINSPWATVIPRRTLVIFVFLLSTISVMLALGVLQILPIWTQNLTQGMGILLLGFCIVIMMSRKKVFPRSVRVIFIVAGVMGFLNLAFGLTIEMVIDFLKMGARWIGLQLSKL